jgi:hypothetical protein
MLLIRSDSVIRRLPAISFSARQNGSSRLTLVLCPARTMERFTIGDFIAPLSQELGAFLICFSFETAAHPSSLRTIDFLSPWRLEPYPEARLSEALVQIPAINKPRHAPNEKQITNPRITIAMTFPSQRLLL